MSWHFALKPVTCQIQTWIRGFRDGYVTVGVEHVAGFCAAPAPLSLTVPAMRSSHVVA